MSRFLIGRFLGLTGSVDGRDTNAHWYQLPRLGDRRTRGMTARAPISTEFLNDAKFTPRGLSSCSQRAGGRILF